MPSRNTILKFLHDFLNVDEFEDFCINGLQIEGKEHIEKIVLGVSVSERLFREAINRDADMIIVHHGIFWKNDPRPYTLTGIARNRIALLLKNDVNLAGYHLPLDAHPEVGNNIQIIKKLDMEMIKPVDVGFLAKLKTPKTINDLFEKVKTIFGSDCMLLPYGKEQVSMVLIISGGAPFDYPLALENGADTFITGEIKESLVRVFEEVRLNFINAGHYNSEKFGVQELGVKLQQEFDISCEFVDIPNPV